MSPPRRPRVLLWTALIANMKEGTLNPAGHMNTGSVFVCVCVCVSVHHHLLSVFPPPVYTQIDKLSPNCFLVHFSNLTSFYKVAFCSACVFCQLQHTPFLFFSPYFLFSTSSPSLNVRCLAISGLYFCSTINNSSNRTTQWPTVRA